VEVNSAVTKSTRTFTRVSEWEKDVEYARIYAGFHYHHSVVEGVALGKKVSDQVGKNYFQPLAKH
jgi:hypothetical protein